MGQNTLIRRSFNFSNSKISLWIVFAVAMLARLLFNLVGPGFGSHLFCCDGFEYLSDAQALYQFIIHNAAQLSSVHGLSVAGPFFPLFIVASYAICGLNPLAYHALPLLLTQSFVSSLTCVFVASISRLCWDRKVALPAGIAAAIYPAFIVNTGRLCNEIFATFLLVGLLLLACRHISKQPAGYRHTIAIGMMAAVLQLTRSAMFTIVVIVLAFIVYGVISHGKKPLQSAVKVIVGFVLGFIILITPWICFSGVALGNPSPFIDRHSHYNLYIGNNVDTLGWLSVPPPDLSGIDQVSFWKISYYAFKKSPVRWCQLLLDKPIRLFKFPWNDFRSPLGTIDYHQQVLLHQALLLLSVMGLGLTLFVRRLDGFESEDIESADQEQLFIRQLLCRLLLLSVLSYHLIYILVIAMARYNLTAMPIVIIFAAAVCVRLFYLLRTEITYKTGVRIIAAAVLLFLAVHVSFNLFARSLELLPFGLYAHPIFMQVVLVILKALVVIFFFWVLWPAAILTFASRHRLEKSFTTISIVLLAAISLLVLTLPARANGRLFEIQSRVNSGSREFSAIIPITNLINDSEKPKACFLLLDSNGIKTLQQDINIIVNGRKLSGPFVPGLSLLGNLSSFQALDAENIYLECGFIFSSLSGPSHISNVDLRQWFLVPLPDELIRDAQKEGYLKVKLLPARSSSNAFTLYAQLPVNKHVMVPSIDRCSWEKSFFGDEDSCDFSDPRYDLELPNKATCGSIPDLLVLTSAAEFVNRTPLLAPIHVEQTSIDCLTIRSQSFPTYKNGDFWIVRLSGSAEPEAKFSSKPTSIIPAVSITSRYVPSAEAIKLPDFSGEWGQKGRSYGTVKAPRIFTYNCPWIPQSFIIISNSSKNNFDFSFPLIPSALPGKLQSITLRLNSNGNPVKTAKCTMEIYRLHANPLTNPYNVQLPTGCSMSSSTGGV